MLTFNAGIQGTIRRDSISPQALNQNLFRVLYIHDDELILRCGFGQRVFHTGIGPVYRINLHSRTLVGGVDFRVGQPWGKTALVTGWAASDQQFQPENTR